MISRKFRSSAAMALCLSSLALAGWATPALAQDAESDGASDNVGDIVVTAQRRNERLIDVPMAVVAVSAEAVERSGVVSVHDINKIAPGVQINFAGCCTQPAVRGVSTLTTGIGFENNVAIYVDGFYVPDNLSLNGDFANLESIEVLKGPQGTLWGRNATGGAILMNTKRPSDVLTGKLELGFARYNEVTASAYVSGPLSDAIRFSLSAYNRKSDGYYKKLDNTGRVVGNAAPIHQTSIRAKVEVDLGETTTATIGANYGLASDPRGNLFTVLEYPSPLLPQPPARANKPFTASFDAPTYLSATVKETTLKLEHQAEFGTITSYTGYAQRRSKLAYDFDASYASISFSNQDWKQRTFQQTVDVNVTAIEGFDFVIGGSYYRDRLGTDKQFGGGSAAVPSRTAVKLRAEAIAGYADATINLADRLTFVAGARYTHEKKEADFGRFNPTTGAQIVGPFFGAKSWNAFTPRGSLRYEITPRTNVYASITRGFRSGGFNPNGAASQQTFLPFNPEKITSYEVGFKTSNPVFQFETAAFYYDFRDLQVGLTRQTEFGLINSVFNAPKAEVYGLDAMITAQPVENLNVRTGGAYLHARYKDFKDVTGIGLNSTTGTNVTNQIQDWSGQQMTRAPKFTANFSVDYTVEGVAGGSVTLATTAQYTTSFVTNNASLYGPLATAALQNKQRYRQPGYATANAQISWTDESEHLKLTGYLNNLTNKVYRMSYNGQFIGDYATYAQPRTWGVRLGYEF